MRIKKSEISWTRKCVFALFIFYYLTYILLSRYTKSYDFLTLIRPKCNSLEGLQKGENLRYSFFIWVGRLISKLFLHIWKGIEVFRVCRKWRLRNQFTHDFMQFCLSELQIILIRFWLIADKRGSHHTIFVIPKILCLILNKLPYYIFVASASFLKFTLELFKITSWIFSTFSGLLKFFGRPDRSALSALVRSQRKSENHFWIISIDCTESG